MKKFIFIILTCVSIIAFGENNYQAPDSLLKSTVEYRIKSDKSIMLIDSNCTKNYLYPDFGLLSNWDISFKLGVIRNIPFDSRIFTGVSTSCGVGLYKPLNTKYLLNINFNYHRLTNEVGDYFDINGALQYKIIDLCEKSNIHNNSNTECNVYFTLGGGLGKTDGGYYQSLYGEYNYEMFLGFAVTCKYKYFKLRFEDNIYLPGKLAWDGFNLYKPSRNYFHCWTMGISFNLGLTKKDKIMLENIIHILENK